VTIDCFFCTGSGLLKLTRFGSSIVNDNGLHELSGSMQSAPTAREHAAVSDAAVSDETSRVHHAQQHEAPELHYY
jgi:hypothetical protein